MTTPYENRYYVVLISADGYSVLSRHTDINVASWAAIEAHKRGSRVVLREGATGARYCMRDILEAEEELKGDPEYQAILDEALAREAA